MSKGIPRKTLGVAALGAAMAATAAGTASAAGPTDNLMDAAADVQNLSVEDRVMDLPGDVTQAAGAVQESSDRAVPAAGQDPVGGLLGGLPLVGQLQGAGLPTDQLAQGALPTDQLSGGLSADNLAGGGLPSGDLGGLTGGLPL
ncbi:hypothetical protein GCM10023347_13880 [Streptomyces chumphonensis]|uniref:ATP-binding protein n=1 Tax=Streptomyces chumphonensis TaxID=1214925 RepID=A0A927F0U5_9ACTN|nr:ATP-binding protein [Streptomyces chumphonensis]MBD3932287.1 ATP-binding protein [Streptomyces chumphonensis]